MTPTSINALTPEPDPPLTKDEAEKKADARNAELGACRDQERFAMAVQLADGRWTVEERVERESWRSRIFWGWLRSGG